MDQHIADYADHLRPTRSPWGLAVFLVLLLLATLASGGVGYWFGWNDGYGAQTVVFKP